MQVLNLILLLSAFSLDPTESAEINDVLCPVPEVSYGRGNGTGDVQALISSFKEVQEVEFEVQVGPTKREKQRCKLICQEGQWVGPRCMRRKRNSTVTQYLPMKRSCEINISPPRQILTYKFREITINSSTLFPHGTSISLRCNTTEPGLLAQEGNATLKCIDGDWEKRIPVCRETSSPTNFSLEMPPRIMVHVSNGVMAVGPAGEILVYPDSIVHLDCVFDRRIGNPDWFWKNEGKQYGRGWVASGFGKNWYFRLSLVYVSLGVDSNRYVCRTPIGKANAITVKVTDVTCPPLNISDVELESRLEGNRIGQKATFVCPSGFQLNGVSEVVCQANGQWSGSPATCEPILCSALEIADPHLRVFSLNNSFEGVASFVCPFGYKLVGAESIRCQAHGQWTDHVPACQAVECPPPLPLTNGKMSTSERHLVGDTVQYSCNEGFVLLGEPIISCTESGKWSHSTPFCKRACQFPGHPDNGRVTPVRFFYEIGDRAMVRCDPGYFISTGNQSKKIKCLDTGQWSSKFPVCLSYMS